MIYIDDSEPEGVLAPAFSYRDVTINRGVDAHEIYDIISEVGRGKFGTVYKCQEKATGLKLAAKFVPIPKRDDKRNVEREVEIMNSLQHHLIIQLYAAYEYQKMMCVVLELVEGGELFDRVIDDDFVLTERVCVVFIRQVCEAMEFIHRNNILHLDLKPENILCLTQAGNRIKIIDFGLARKYDPNKRLQILFGTPEFVAPEVVNFDCIAYGTDMWSVGVICYVLISGLSPFMGETDIETMANVTIAKYDFEDESFGSVSGECLDFISKLLVKDLSTRMTAAQCLQHKWLQRRPPAVAANKLVTAQRALEPPRPAAINVPDNEGKGLDSTKDNLKNFIERWEEHPNSPYVFDVEANVIAPINETMYKQSHGVDSISSSRVCSPSPCESIGTVTDDDVAIYDDDSVEMKTPINLSREQLFASTSDGGGASGSGSGTPTPHHMPLQLGLHRALPADRSLMSYLHTFDRRNSDTNYLLGRRSSGERVNLADEIRKLSDHLLMLAEINTKFGGDAGMNEDANNNVSEKAISAMAAATTSTVGAAATTSAVATAATTSTTSTTTSSSGIMKTTKTVQKMKNKSVIMSNIASDSANNALSLRLEKSIEETPQFLANGNIAEDMPGMGTKDMGAVGATTKTKARTKTKTTKTKANAIESASVRRAKFRINQMSRDVPIGLPDTHQTVNLEEAANTTKDCLLHLLEKYNDTKSRNPLGRHQSISVDWNVSDNLEYRSMNSINAFFQRHINTQNKVKQLQAQLENKTSGK